MTIIKRTPLSNLAALACVAALLLAACAKKGSSEKKESDDEPDKKPAMGALMAAKPAPAKATPIEWVTVALPKTKLKITVPKGTKVTEAIIPNTDWVKLPGGRHTFVVRKWQHGDKTLDRVIKWAKGHQIQKYQGDVLKKGSGKIYTYVYKVNMGGMRGAVYHQYKEVGGQVFRCFANAKSEAAARLFHRSCNSLSK